ncbi:hypothetical protein D3C84_881600 [compost metagenome]
MIIRSAFRFATPVAITACTVNSLMCKAPSTSFMETLQTFCDCPAAVRQLPKTMSASHAGLAYVSSPAMCAIGLVVDRGLRPAPFGLVGAKSSVAGIKFRTNGYDMDCSPVIKFISIGNTSWLCRSVGKSQTTLYRSSGTVWVRDVFGMFG